MVFGVRLEKDPVGERSFGYGEEERKWVMEDEEGRKVELEGYHEEVRDNVDMATLAGSSIWPSLTSDTLQHEDLLNLFQFCLNNNTANL